MDLESLRSFVWAVRLGSLTAAAKRLCRTQPALSVQIQGLEREAGDRLLVREARGVRPTPTGELLYRRAQHLLLEADDLVAELQAAGSLERGRLRLGATDLTAIHLLPRVLKRYRQRYPGVQIGVQVEGSRGLQARVLRGDLDLALVTLPQEHPDLESELLQEDEVIWITAPDHPLSGRRRVRLEALSSEPLIHHGPESITRAEVERALRDHGLEARVSMEVNSPEAIKQLVGLGLGIAPLAESQVRAEIRSGRLGRFQVQGLRMSRRSGVVRRRDLRPIRAAEALLQMLRPSAKASTV